MCQQSHLFSPVSSQDAETISRHTEKNCPHSDGATRQLGSRGSAERQTAFTLAAVQRCSDFAHSWPSLLIEIHRPTFKEGTGNGSGGGGGSVPGGGFGQMEQITSGTRALLKLKVISGLPSKESATREASVLVVLLTRSLWLRSSRP